MLIVTALYVGVVYLVFFKLELLPFNKLAQAIVLVVGVVLLTVFLVGLQTLTPVSKQAVIAGHVTEIAPQVQGQVIDVPIAGNEKVGPGDLLFQIDPAPFQNEVDRLSAQLADTESQVAQLKESYDAARAQTRGTETQLQLSRMRLGQHRELVDSGAGSAFDVERYETEVASLQQQLQANRAQENQARLGLEAQIGDEQAKVAQVLAALETAQFYLENTSVLAPADGLVTLNVLREGMVVSPSRSVVAFVYQDQVTIAALFSQKALENIRVGQLAKINFPALPGRVFEGEVVAIADAIGEGQFAASGQLPRITMDRMKTLYPVRISLPADFPEEHIRLGLAADVYIHTDGAGVVGLVALILQWISTSMDYVV